MIYSTTKLVKPFVYVRARVYVRKKNRARSARAAKAEISNVSNQGMTAAEPQEREQVTENHLPTVCAAGPQLTQWTIEEFRYELASGEWKKYGEKGVDISVLGKEEVGKENWENSEGRRESQPLW